MEAFQIFLGPSKSGKRIKEKCSVRTGRRRKKKKREKEKTGESERSDFHKGNLAIVQRHF